jgi:hypothetical protein
VQDAIGSDRTSSSAYGIFSSTVPWLSWNLHSMANAFWASSLTQKMSMQRSLPMIVLPTRTSR